MPPIRIHRRFLYVGVFLLAIGGILVAAELGLLDPATVADLLRLWPLALIAVGLGVVLRRTDLALPSGMLAVALPGLVLGGALAVAPRYVGDCGARGDPITVATEQGTFDGPAQVTIISGCGSLAVGTAPGNAWQLMAANTAGRSPSVRAESRSLSIAAYDDADGWNLFDAGRDRWDVTLPTTDLDRLSHVAHFGRSQLVLPGARIADLVLTANASDVFVDASAASVASLTGTVNVGRLSILLPASDLTGSLRIGGAELQLCTRPDLGLRITTRGFPHDVTVAGLQQAGSDWQSPNYATAAYRADLRVTINVGSVDIDPIGGCR